jgi:hypothetical protein
MMADAVSIVNLGRTHRVPWDDFVGFIGERSGHDGRCVLMRRSGEPIRLSGLLNGEELNPYGEEGDLSAIDELNLAVAAYRRELLAMSAISVMSAEARRLSAAG